jgi:4-hydroxyphenylpyruvate dioxygenase
MLTHDGAGSAPESAIEPTGIEYLELYVGNVHQAAHFYRTAYGFTPIAVAGLETGRRDRVSVALEQNDIRLVLTGALDSQSQIAAHVGAHGDGVKDIALGVGDARAAFATMVKRGARPIMEPVVMEDEGGKVVKATVGTFGDAVHSLIQRDGYKGPFLPGYKRARAWPQVLQLPLKTIDHLAICVEMGALDQWMDFYKRVFDFRQSHQEDVETEYSAMNSRVAQDQTGKIKLTILEPAEGLRRSQIEEFLMFYGGAGVQHIAFSSDDIIYSVQTLRSAGNEFLTPPATYYETLKKRVGEISESLNDLRENNVLVDRDQWGYLMQIFTKPIESRPTLFLEVIQRKQARGFGGGNIRALFESIEREQAMRGNL